MKKVEIYFDYVSPFPYFLNERIERDQVAAQFGLDIEWVPIFLGSLYPDNNHMPTNATDARRMLYSGIEAARYARELGVPYVATFFQPVPVLRAALAAKRQGLFPEFHTALYRRLHGEGATPDEALFASLVEQLGGDAARLQADVKHPEVKQELVDNAVRARQNNVFGVPFVFCEGTPYWGYSHFPYLLRDLAEAGAGG